MINLKTIFILRRMYTRTRLNTYIHFIKKKHDSQAEIFIYLLLLLFVCVDYIF